MVLNPHPIYPFAGHYVLRLHRDARLQGSALAGRIEHVKSGDSCDFSSSQELLAWIERRACEHPNSKENE